MGINTVTDMVAKCEELVARQGGFTPPIPSEIHAEYREMVNEARFLSDEEKSDFRDLLCDTPEEFDEQPLAKRVAVANLTRAMVNTMSIQRLIGGLLDLGDSGE
jgi:hypothetical protein